MHHLSAHCPRRPEGGVLVPRTRATGVVRHPVEWETEQKPNRRAAAAFNHFSVPERALYKDVVLVCEPRMEPEGLKYGRQVFWGQNAPPPRQPIIFIFK